MTALVLENVEVDDEDTSCYFTRHKIDNLLLDFRNRLSNVKPADPLKFLHDYLGDLITLEQEFEWRESKIISNNPSLDTFSRENCLINRSEKIQSEPELRIYRWRNTIEKLKNANTKETPEAINHTNHSSPREIHLNEGCFGQQNAMIQIDERGEGLEDHRTRTSSRILTLENGESILLDSFLQKSIEPTTIWAIDIGGTLSKIVVWEPNNLAESNPLHNRLMFLKSNDTYGQSGHRDSDMEISLENGTFHFIYFSTNRMKEATKLFSNFLQPKEKVAATGGGAYKYANLLMEKTDCVLEKFDELKSLLFGLDFLLHNVEDECFYYENPTLEKAGEKMIYNISQDTYPYLLCNIGSGVSIILVEGPHHFNRVSGSCIGGGTFIGLCRLLCDRLQPEKCKTFKGSDAFMMAFDGVANNVDMTVGDIYGGAYESFNLRADTVASAFGKVATKPALLSSMKPLDLAQSSARSLLNMIGMNIAQLAYLCAMRYKVKNILFCGNFLRQKFNKLSQGSISYSINYWSGGAMKACFLKHEGYFGAIGAYVLRNNRRLLFPGALSESFSEQKSNQSN